MAGKRISDKMEKLLNTQMTREAYQAQVYLAYGSWAETLQGTGRGASTTQMGREASTPQYPY